MSGHFLKLKGGRRPREPSRMGRSLAGLGGLNFFLADAQGGLGPFLGIYLLGKPGWNAATIGLIMTLGVGATLIAQTPAGALTDRTRPTPATSSARQLRDSPVTSSPCAPAFGSLASSVSS